MIIDGSCLLMDYFYLLVNAAASVVCRWWKMMPIFISVSDTTVRRDEAWELSFDLSKLCQTCRRDIKIIISRVGQVTWIRILKKKLLLQILCLVLYVLCRHLIKVACGKKATKKLVALTLLSQKDQFLKRPLMWSVVLHRSLSRVPPQLNCNYSVVIFVLKQKSELSWLM